MTFLYAKGDGEPLCVHTQKVVAGINHLQKSLHMTHPVFTEEFWQYLKYAAIIHDFGKASDNFQDYIKQFIEGEKPKTRIRVEDLVPHSSLSPVFCNWFEWDMPDYWRRMILSAVYFHHDRSKLYQLVSEGRVEKIQLGELDKLRKEFEHLGREYSALITRAPGTINYRFLKFLIAPGIVYLKPLLQKDVDRDDNQQKTYIFFKGLLHRADHFASSLPDGTSDIHQIEIEPLHANTVEKNIIEEITGKKGEPGQLWQLKEIRDRNLKNRNTILIGSTGIGKTEFAFLWGSGKKTFFALPMRTMTDQIFKRARTVFEQKVGLLHSSAIAVLPRIIGGKDECETSDIESHMNLARNLAFPVIVCTGDQVLNVSLKYPGYEKIMAAMGYSNIVIDEIQAYSPETSAVIVKTIEDIARMEGNFLLMTATLPEYIKMEIKNRIKVEDSHIFSIYSKMGAHDFRKHKIHLVSTGHEAKKEKNDREEKLEIDEQTFYQCMKRIIANNPGKRVLITVNTVKNSQLLFQRLIKDDDFLQDIGLLEEDILLLHARFIGKHRQEKVDRLTGGKEKQKKHREVKILITTQIIEASVDIDYDILVSELAPLDSLMQRMGRVNRNRGEYREGTGEVHIINGYLKGSDSVYKKNTLNLTSGFLDSEDIRNKVISEKEKERLLELYYGHEDYKPIKDQFKKNLDTLDNLFLASSKREAQNIFREVNSVTVLPDEILKEFEKQFLEGETGIFGHNREDNNLLKKKFKVRLSGLLMDYSTSIRYDVYKRMHTVELGTYLSENDLFLDLNKRFDLRRFLKGYFVIPRISRWRYTYDLGLYEINGIKI